MKKRMKKRSEWIIKPDKHIKRKKTATWIVHYTHADRLYLYGNPENICSVASRKYIIYMNVHDIEYRI